MAAMKPVTRPAVRPAVKPAKPAGASQIAGRPTSTGGAALPNNQAAPNMNKPMPLAAGGAAPGGLPPQIQALAADPAFRNHVLNGGMVGQPVPMQGTPQSGVLGDAMGGGGGASFDPMAVAPRMPSAPGQPVGLPPAMNAPVQPPQQPTGMWRGPNKPMTQVFDQGAPAEIPPGDEMQRLSGGPLMAPPGGMDARTALRNALRGSGSGSLFGGGGGPEVRRNYQQ